MVGKYMKSLPVFGQTFGNPSLSVFKQIYPDLMGSKHSVAMLAGKIQMWSVHFIGK